MTLAFRLLHASLLAVLASDRERERRGGHQGHSATTLSTPGLPPLGEGGGGRSLSRSGTVKSQQNFGPQLKLSMRHRDRGSMSGKSSGAAAAADRAFDFFRVSEFEASSLGEDADPHAMLGDGRSSSMREPGLGPRSLRKVISTMERTPSVNFSASVKAREDHKGNHDQLQELDDAIASFIREEDRVKPEDI